jgi:hypothetical protein
MSTLQTTPRARHKPRTGPGTAAVAVGALVAVAVTVLMLALISEHQNAPTHPHATHTVPIEHHGNGGCTAVSDPLSGQMHGGCARKQTNANPSTPTP